MYKTNTTICINIDTVVDVGRGLVDCNTHDYYVYIYTEGRRETALRATVCDD